MTQPASALEMAEVLRSASERRVRLSIGGGFSKNLMAGPCDLGAELVSTCQLDRVLAYEPRDLTISVEAGMRWRNFEKLLAANRQMVPLDPGFAEQATVGGVVAANVSGPRRRQYGTARDLVIGMQFATLAGRVVQSGGMVVKNVAGLDMAKLMIGSFGTLAAIAVVNFKVLPLPPEERTYALEFATLEQAITARDKLLQDVWQPGALDLLNPQLAAEFGFAGWTLLLWFGGNEALIRRVTTEMSAFRDVQEEPPAFWQDIRTVSERFMAKYPDGAIVRASSLLSEVSTVMTELPVPALARAGTGVTYAYFTGSQAAAQWLASAKVRGRKAVIEFASQQAREELDLWPAPGSDFAMMKKVKHLFDPEGLLNRGRLYRHL